MEAHGGQPSERDKQLAFRNPLNIALKPPTLQQPQSQPLPHEQLITTPQCVEPTTLGLQAVIELQASTEMFTSTETINSFVATSTSYAGGYSGCSAAQGSTATTVNDSTQAATAFCGSSMGHHIPEHHHHMLQHHALFVGSNASLHQGSASNVSAHTQQHPQQSIDKLSRPLAFDKMELLVREMQDQEHGVPVRQQKIFLTSIPYAFMGYDLIEWLMDRLQIEESEALNIANQLCLHGYFFPVNDSKTLTVKDDSSLYRFQTPYYWPWQHKAPDNVEYAIYLAKRSLRNRQRHALEDYEAEALASLHKNLKGKWDFISMQAEEQVRLAKERKKGDKIVGDSQERAFWRVHRPPPGQLTPLELCPVPSRHRQGVKLYKKKTADEIQRDVEFLRKSLNRTRMKMSQACEFLVCYSETFSEYDFFLQTALPSNPWVTEDIAFWQLNSTFVEIPTEKRVKRWAISIEELVSDPTGLQEFTNFLEKEYSHENIRFWIAVNRLRHSAHSQVARKVNDIYEEFLKPGAPCEINIDGKTMETVLRGLKNPTRFTFDSASEHIYMLLLKKDCYPRFVRSEYYKRLVDCGIQPSHKKRFFNFGAVSGAKKKMTAALSSQPNLGEATRHFNSAGTAGGTGSIAQVPPPNNISRRRGSDRSFSGSVHELAISVVSKDSSKVSHSHSQNNLSEITYSDVANSKFSQLGTTVERFQIIKGGDICQWDEQTSDALSSASAQVKLSKFPRDLKSKTAETSHTWSAINAVSTLPPGKSDNKVEPQHQESTWEYQSAQMNCPSTKTSPSDKMRYPLLYAKHYCALSDSSKNIKTKELSDFTDVKAGEICRSPTPETVFLVSPETPLLKSPIVKITSACMECAPNVQQDFYGTHVPTSMTVQLHHESSTSSPCTERQLELDFFAVKEVLIELIEPHAYNSYDTQLEVDARTSTNILPNIDDPAKTEDSLCGSQVKTLIETSPYFEKKLRCPVQRNIEAELSPTTDEYQEEMHFGDDSKDAVYKNDTVDTNMHPKYIPPAPTPPPLMAPLAVLDIDTVDDEIINEFTPIETQTIALRIEEQRRRRKKRSSEEKKNSVIDDKGNEMASASSQTASDETEQNAVCPWENQKVSTSGDTFVKTYATLGYL